MSRATRPGRRRRRGRLRRALAGATRAACGSALALNPPLDGADARSGLRGGRPRRRRRCSSRSATRCEEIVAPWSGTGCCADFTRAFGPGISMTTLVGGRAAGREPAAEDVEPLTWAMWERARAAGHADRCWPPRTSSSGWPARLVTVLAALRRGRSRRRWRSGRCRSARSTAAAPIRGSNYRRSAAFTPYTAIVNVTGQPAISLPLYHGDDGLPTAVQLIGPPAREEVLLALAAPARGGAAVGDRVATRVRSPRLSHAEHGAHRPRVTPRRSASAVPWRGDQRHLQQLGLVPGGERRRAAEQLDQLQDPAGQPGPASAATRRRRCSERSTSSTISRWVSVSGPASS